VRVNRSLAFSLGLLVVSALGVGWALQGEGADEPRAEVAKLSRWLGALEPEPVLIVVLGAEGTVRDVRTVISADRIVAETATAFAVRERRIVAETFDEAGPVLMAAGWRDAPIEIIALRRHALAQAQALTAAPVDRVAALMNQPTLNMLEARSLLDHL
jgi:hypothetical protein